MKLNLLLGVALFLATPAVAEEAPQLIETQNAEVKGIAMMLTNRLTSVVQEGQSARITSSGPLSADGNHTYVHVLTLRVGEGFDIPDHHAEQQFTLMALTNTGILLGYSIRFDHRSFSANKITHDVGTVEINWHSGKTN